jgi:hypothetical protein
LGKRSGEYIWYSPFGFSFFTICQIEIKEE